MDSRRRISTCLAAALGAVGVAADVVADLTALGPWLAGHLERTGGRAAPASGRA